MRHLFQFLFVVWAFGQFSGHSFGETVVAVTSTKAAASDETKPKRVAKVAFTFDCAQWGDVGLDHILEVMKRSKITGTFFVTGKFIETNKEGILKIVDAGHEVANHSYEHDKRNSVEECDRVAQLYEDATGRQMSRFFRAPYLYERKINWPSYAKSGWKEGYVSLITCDALPEYKLISDTLFLKNFSIYVAQGSSERIAIGKTAFQSGPGHINGAAILMHIDGYRFHLLENMIDIVQRGGYQCATFSEAYVAREEGNPFPESEGREMIPLDLSLLESSQTESVAAALALAKLADPKPDLEKMAAARKAFLKNGAGGVTSKRGEISFTFDCDHHSPIGLWAILATLERNSVQSTFYITENYLKEYPGAVRAILEHGHEIANYGKSGDGTITPEDADSFAALFKEDTGEEMIRLYRPPSDSAVEGLDWNPFAEHGWRNGYVSLDAFDSDEDARTVSDGSFVAYFKIYVAIAPKLQVPITKIPYSGTGNIDGAVVAMQPKGFRYHLLEKMIFHAREKGYAPVAQSKLTMSRF